MIKGEVKLARRWPLVIAIFLLAMTLREPLLSISPLLTLIQESYGLAGQEAGFLTTIPLLVFAVASPFVGTIGARFGVGRLITWFLAMMAIGAMIRYVGSVFGLYFGTFLIALGIVAGNVLIPALISAFLPDRVGMMTGIYTTLMQTTTGAALATVAVMAPALGWNLTIFIWSIPILIALFAWLPLYRLRLPEKSNTEKKPTVRSLYRHALAWDVSFFMGIQSLLFYTVTTWYPTIIMDQGLTREAAGVQAFVYQMTSLVASFLTPMLVKGKGEQKWIATALCALYAAGIFLIPMSNGSLLYVASSFMGISAGATFSLALMYFIWRTSSPLQVAVLSGMGQAIGYTLAAGGPILVGYMHEQGGSWESTFFFLLIFCFLYGISGYRAGRDRTL